jgi:hypothetical protein
MGPGNPQKIKAKVEALQLSAEGLFKLLGSNDPDKKQQFIEILKGVTSRADFVLVESHLAQAQAMLSQVEASVKALTQTAKELGGGTATAAH